MLMRYVLTLTDPTSVAVLLDIRVMEETAQVNIVAFVSFVRAG